MDPKHIAHVNARMEVWRKGYGLYCDVNGVLYCYGVRTSTNANVSTSASAQEKKEGGKA
jgi:hypothetical protein